MAKQLFAWWYLAEHVSSRLTRPRTDVSSSDRSVERIIRESALYALVDAVSAGIGSAWLRSRVRFSLQSLVRGWEQQEVRGALKLRVIAWAMEVAAATTLGLQALRPTGFDPLGWVVPLDVALIGLVLLGVSARMERSGGKNHARHGPGNHA